MKNENIYIQELQEKIKILERQLSNPQQFGLVWEEAYQADDKSVSDFIEVKEREIHTNSHLPANLLIEGDNLHSLNYLYETHKDKINIIYIDPPYNTGNKDFKYADHFTHSKWLSFMNKRLLIAKELLSEDGVIFVSIDDNELYHLKLLLDNIFGEKNFIVNFIRKSGTSARQDAKFISKENDYVLCYAKNINKLIFNKQLLNVNNDKGYKFEDEYVSYRGKYKLNKLDRGSIKFGESLVYPIEAPDKTLILPGNGRQGWCWRWSKEKLKWGLDNGFIEFKKVKDSWSVYFKQYQYVDNKDKIIQREIPYKNLLLEGFQNEKGNQELKDILHNTTFSYPKPKDLIIHLLSLHTNKQAIVLDFFAGSGTTGHAVLELNQRDQGQRQFILCTNNENNICEEVTYQRLHNVIKGYKNLKGQDFKGLGGNLKYFKI